MKISPEKLAAEAEATGFRPEVLEKAAQCQPLLEWKALNVRHQKLRGE